MPEVENAGSVIARVHQTPSRLSLVRRMRRRFLAALPMPLRNLKLSRFYTKYGELELELMDLLCARPSDAIDVGANEGMYTHFMQRFAHQVIAFEPLESLADQLRRRQYANVAVREEALSDRIGMATLYIPLAGGAAIDGLSSLEESLRRAHDLCGEQHVRLARLDDVYAGNVGFIKIDVEGHEVAVLRGAIDTIARQRPALLVECEEAMNPGGLAQIELLLHPHGYAGYFIHRGQLRPLADFSVAGLQAAAALQGYGPGRRRRDFPDFVSNFLFLRREDRQLHDALAARVRRIDT